MDTAIKKAEDKMVFFTNNTELLREYYMREMAEMDLLNIQNYSLQKGRAEGKIEGKIEGKTEARYEIFASLAKNGISTNDIARLTNTPIEDVYTILANN